MTLPVTNEKEREVALDWIDKFEDSLTKLREETESILDDNDRRYNLITIKAYEAQQRELQEAVWAYDTHYGKL